MTYENNILRADDGKVLRRKSDKMLFGTEKYLGKTWFINNTPLAEPLVELPEHFEELTEEELEEERKYNEYIGHKKIGIHVDELIRERYSISEELAILRQRDVKPDEFAEYNAFCEECKRKIKEEML